MGYTRSFQFGVLGVGVLIIQGNSSQHQVCVTFSLTRLSLSIAKGSSLELDIITKTGTGGRGGKDGSHAASRGGLVLYK